MPTSAIKITTIKSWPRPHTNEITPRYPNGYHLLADRLADSAGQ